MLLSLAPILSLLSITTAIPLANANAHSPHGRAADHAPHAAHAKRQSDGVAAAVSGLAGTLPRPPLPAHALLTTGASVDLLPVSGHRSIDSSSYSILTRALPGVMTHAIESSIHSWEIGSLVESLLEVYVPKLAPFEFTSDAFAADIPWAALWVVEAWLDGYDWQPGPSRDVDVTNAADLARYLDSSTTPTALWPQPLINGDGALGDPAALGMGAWLLARFATRSDVRNSLSTGVTAAQLAWAAGNQLAHMRNGHSSENGTISQREGHFQLWADMGSMIPPYPAYLGADTRNDDLLSLAIDQWILESSALLDESKGLYRHINDFDPAFWATGNGWMAHGAMRVLASISSAGRSSAFTSKIEQVRTTLGSVFTALFGQLNNEGLLPNYMLSADTSYPQSGGETAGTSLVVAAYYRYIKMFPSSATNSNNAGAARAFDGVVAKLNDDGWLTSVVNPMGPWIIDGAHSPEGQSFVGMMWAARTAAGI